MSQLQLAAVLSLDKAQQTAYLSDFNVQLEKMSAIQRIEWALEHLPAEFVLSSSFGIQAALTLHMVTQIVPD
ncbi:TPA: phosphoadenosine phosphosulfate reductase, partial [Pseudomonas aeruginosa]